MYCLLFTVQSLKICRQNVSLYGPILSAICFTNTKLKDKMGTKRHLAKKINKNYEVDEESYDATLAWSQNTPSWTH